MTLHRLRPVCERAVTPSLRVARRLGLSPDAVSLLALVAAGGAAIGFARTWYLTGVLLVAVSGWLDLLDGMVARDRGVDGPAGFLLDQTLDRYADLLVVVGLAAGVARPFLGIAAVTGVLMTSFVGLGTKATGLDGLLTGSFCRADRLTAVTVAGIVAAFVDVGAIAALLVLLAIVGNLTAVGRLYRARRELAPEPPSRG